VATASPSSLEFCSITDAKYVAQVIVMHRSLREVVPGARNEVLCVEPRAHRALEAIGLPGLVPVPIEELEERDPELRAVRSGRSVHEYCQTAKPAFCLDLLRRYEDAAWITYVDADSMFFSPPRPVFEELEGSSVGIIGHRLAPRFEHRERWASPYCPSWLNFASDARALEVAAWWRERCLEWCFHRVEGDRHSDQGYLRDWPERFEGVRVLEHPGIGPAPWTKNDGLRREEGGEITIDGVPLILFHYQSLRVHRKRRRPGLAKPLAGTPIPFSWRVHRHYRLSEVERKLVWRPYLERMAEAVGQLRAADPSLVDEMRPPNLRAIARAFRQDLWIRKHRLAAALRLPSDRTSGDGGVAPE
jgi:hypothetical protein